MYSVPGICASLEYFSTRINPIINKIKNNNKEELNSFCKSKVDLNSFNQKGIDENVVICANNQVSSTPYTPCVPEGIIGSQASVNELDCGKPCEVCHMDTGVEWVEFGSVDRWCCKACTVRAKEIKAEQEESYGK
jgi:hypothetical protein